jgi:hypothetical protein
MLTLLPAARGLAVRLLPPPRLPGAERLASDVKAAAYLESAVIVLAIPAAAVLFGRVLPRLLASRASADPLFAELPGAAFGVSFLLWRLGAAPALALALGFSASAALGAAVLVSGDNPKSFSLLETANRDALAFVVAACAAWGLSWKSARLEGAGLESDSIAAMALLFALALAVVLLPGRLRKKI